METKKTIAVILLCISIFSNKAFAQTSVTEVECLNKYNQFMKEEFKKEEEKNYEVFKKKSCIIDNSKTKKQENNKEATTELECRKKYELYLKSEKDPKKEQDNYKVYRERNCKIAPAPSSPTPSLPSIPNPLSGIGVTSVFDLVEMIVKFIVAVGAPLCVIAIIWAGFTFILAQGDPNKLKEAKERLKWTLIGTAILFGASLITKVISGTPSWT